MMAAVSITPLPSAFATTTVACDNCIHQARNSQERISAKFEWIAETIVNTTQNDVYRLQSFKPF